MLAKYIAYKLNRPFLYVRFSMLVESHLGETQLNIAKIFNYIKTIPCVLCFDEIDAIGMKRGQKDDVGEMSRIVVALMQEMNNLPNDVVIIGTTNRYSDIDTALARRFRIKHNISRLDVKDIQLLVDKFFKYAGVKDVNWDDLKFTHNETVANVVEKCTDIIINEIIGRGK